MTRRLARFFLLVPILIHPPELPAKGLSVRPNAPGSLHVIAIGISRYDVPNALALSNCTPDAVAFANEPGSDFKFVVP